ncbi:MAG: hypothetical protein KGY81_05360 [Phycisphaerae bacterium]|jgi:hypothetical protein|nr:hypothetical protein [Phycisphaerae bacterium]
MNQAPKDILDLIDRFKAAERSEKNRRKRARWRGWPGRLDEPGFPVTIEPEAPMWSDILGFDLVGFYLDPEEYLRRNLQMALYRFDRWDEDTPLERRIRIWMGVSFEASLFGAQTRYAEHECPWISGGPVIADETAFESLALPDFFTSGLMPRAHEFYDRIRRMLPEDFEVDFPDWERSPFGVCNHIRGTENLLVDIVQEPQFANRQISFMTECRKRWASDRAEFLGRDVEPGVLLNDEVNGELFPPTMYEEFILPGEIDLGRFQGITYWHSCGNVTGFLGLIRRVPGLEVFHVGPRTDITAAASEMEGLALQVCLDPVADIQRGDEHHITGRLRHIASACQSKPFTIRADGLHTIDTLDRELGQIDAWLDLAKAVREEHA